MAPYSLLRATSRALEAKTLEPGVCEPISPSTGSVSPLAGVGSVAVAIPQFGPGFGLSPPFVPPALSSAGAASATGVARLTGLLVTAKVATATIAANVAGVVLGALPKTTGDVRYEDSKDCANVKFKFDGASGTVTRLERRGFGKWQATGSQNIAQQIPGSSTFTPADKLPNFNIPGMRPIEPAVLGAIQGRPAQKAPQAGAYTTPANDSATIWSTATPSTPLETPTLMMFDGVPMVPDGYGLFETKLRGIGSFGDFTASETLARERVDALDPSLVGEKTGFAEVSSEDGEKFELPRLRWRGTLGDGRVDRFESGIIGESELPKKVQESFYGHGHATIQFGFRVNRTGQKVYLGEPKKFDF
jgi:hypothetical protein